MTAKSEKGRILVIGTVKGLVSEAEKVKTEFFEFVPDVMAISISKEGLQAMSEHERSGENNDAGFDNFEEEYYAKALGRFGKVKKPPPCFVEAWRLSVEKDIPIVAIDFDDEEFTDLFCRHVSGVEWLKQPSKQRGLARKKFNSRTAQEFAVEWDHYINRTKGMRSMEDARVYKISKEVNELAKRYGKVMLVVDCERAEEVRARLLDSGCRLQTIRP